LCMGIHIRAAIFVYLVHYEYYCELFFVVSHVQTRFLLALGGLWEELSPNWGSRLTCESTCDALLLFKVVENGVRTNGKELTG
jgi:hypothetical protein